MNQNYWDHLKKILSCKALGFFVIFTTVLCFGFTITNFSIGVDDPAAYHYLQPEHYGSMVQQGRLLHVFYNLLTNAMEFLPFFNDFLGASLLALSALLFCAFFSQVTQGRLSAASLTIFCCVYISNPIIAEKYIYNLDVVVTMFSYCTVALALMYAWASFTSKKDGIKAVLLLIISLASYESFGFLYFCGVFSVFILRIVVNNESIGFKTILKEGIRFAVILICAYVLYYGIVVLTQLATGQYGVFERSTVWTDLSEGVFSVFFRVTKMIAATFLLERYLPIMLFTLFSALGAVLFVALSVKRRNLLVFLCYCGLFLGNLLIHYICGFVMYRAAQTFCFFIAFVVLMLAHVLSDKLVWKKTVILGSVFLVFMQSAELNRWFYNDYIRYQKESAMIHAIAADLVEECDISKPVIFVNDNGMSYFYTYQYYGAQVNGSSVIYWADGAFGETTFPMMFSLFHMHGYDFLVMPTEEQAMEALTVISEMEHWPEAGHIAETDDYIFINFP